MKTIKVLNANQGDSIVINSSKSCVYNNKKIFVDLGPGNIDITKEINDETVHIFLTHHHKDHIGGFKYFVANKADKIERIVLPLFQNEITLIAKAILNLKGIRTAVNCYSIVDELEDIVNNHLFLKSMASKKKGIIQFGYQGKQFCDHIICLNPPIQFASDQFSDKGFDGKIVSQLFEDDFARRIKQYLINHENISLFREFFYDMYINDDEYIRYEREKVRFVQHFIIQNLELFKEFNEKPTKINLNKIYTNYIKYTHDACLVLKVNYNNVSYLLTGDASKKVFKRLIAEKIDIRADYLKMPHHGSIQNMNEKILKAIQPRVAIISHNNGHFGRAIDSHPNMKTLNLLNKFGIKILITNDIIKKGKVLMSKSSYCHDLHVEIG